MIQTICEAIRDRNLVSFTVVDPITSVLIRQVTDAEPYAVYFRRDFNQMWGLFCVPDSAFDEAEPLDFALETIRDLSRSDRTFEDSRQICRLKIPPESQFIQVRCRIQI